MQPTVALRRLATFAAALSLVLGAALAAQAKMPQFTTDVDVDDTTATITVTFDEGTGFAPPQLDGVVAVYPRSAIDDSGKILDESSGIDVSVTRQADGVYEGTVDLERAGSWVAVSMPGMHSDPAFRGADPDVKDALVLYSDPVYFDTEAGTAVGWLVGGAAAVAALGVLVWRPRHLWKPFVATVSVVGIVLVGTAALPGDANANFECPVTIPPQPGFSPPEPWPATSPDDGSVWYGSEGLWTILETDGEYGPRKSVWWSANFPGGAEETWPEVHVTWTRLDTDEPVVFDNDGKGTNAHTGAHGWFMIAGIDQGVDTDGLGEPGCWRVTAEYKGATLSYVYERA